ncbi:unnamed protein product [Amaranthus hypochondriacus]
MATESRVDNIVSNRVGVKQEQLGGRRLIGWLSESIGKYGIDISLNFSPKSKSNSKKAYPYVSYVQAAILVKYIIFSLEHASLISLLSRPDLQLHKIVQEELKDGQPLNMCNDHEKQKLDSEPKSDQEMSKMEKLSEEMNDVMLKNRISTVNVEPISSDKFPPKQFKERSDLIPSRKKIMIRSRL